MAEKPKVSAETLAGPKNYGIERGILRVESTLEAQGNLRAEAEKAEAKYYPRYWYCSSLIVRYVGETLTALGKSPAFLETYQEAMENLTHLYAALDRIMEASKRPFPEALVADQNLPAHIVVSLKTKANKDIQETLDMAGVSSPDRIAWISLYTLFKESSKRSAEEVKKSTLPLERELSNALKVVKVPSLLEDFDRFSDKL